MAFDINSFDPTKRIDFVWAFDVAGGNPNGDPDSENMPRQDPMTERGWVSNGCLKRKIRDYVAATEDLPMYVAQGAILGDKQREAYEALGMKPKNKHGDAEQQIAAQQWLRDKYWDVRVFGGVLTIGEHWGGQVWGPVQIADAKSIDRIHPQQWCITRMAAAKESGGEKDNKTMGRKWLLDYALYRTVATYNPHRAALDLADLDRLIRGMMFGFELAMSSTRGVMGTRHLFAFQHSSKFGSAPLHKLIDSVAIARRDGVEIASGYGDYSVALGDLPNGVTAIDLAA